MLNFIKRLVRKFKEIKDAEDYFNVQESYFYEYLLSDAEREKRFNALMRKLKKETDYIG